VDLQLAEFRQIRGAGDLGRAAAGLGRRRRAAGWRAARRRACALTTSWRWRKGGRRATSQL